MWRGVRAIAVSSSLVLVLVPSVGAAEQSRPEAANSSELRPPGRAAPEPPDEEPVAASFYGEAWALLGAFGDDSPFGVRWSLGLAWRPTRGWGGRVGTSVDVLNGRSSGSAVGIETQVERVFGPQRTLGLRLALARGEGDGSTATLDGTSLSAGLRVQVDPLLLGVDGIVVRGEESTGTGALLGIGVGERPGRYVVAVSAVGAVIGGLFLAALSQSSIH